MEPELPRPIDYKFVVDFLLEMVQEQSLDHLVQVLLRQNMEATRASVVAVVIWLIEKGEGEAGEGQRPSDASSAEAEGGGGGGEQRFLYAVAGIAGASADASHHPPPPSRFPNSLARIPLGSGPIGRIAVTREPCLLCDLDQDPEGGGELAGATDWLKSERIRGFAAVPLVYKGDVLGVLGSFERTNPGPEWLEFGRTVAVHVTAATVIARSFEEIRAAGKRLEQANQRLGQELAERQEAQEKLRQSEQRYRRIVDTASEGIWELDEHYTTTYVNRRMAEMLGFQPEEMVGRNLGEFLFADDLAALPTRIAARRQGLTERFEQKYRHQDGRDVWMHVSATSVRDPEGGFLGSFAMLTDITERKRAEEALRRNEAYLAEGQRLSHTGSWAWNPITLQILYWSEEMFRVFGLDPQEGLPTAEAFWQRVHPEDLDRTRELLLGTAAEKREYEHDHRIVLPDGTVKYIHAIGHPVLDHNGRLAEYVGTAMDVTEIQRLKAQLEQQNEYLREEVVEAKAFGDLVGQSAALSQVVSQIDLVAPTDASVLILGETGTGKELVAHEIHRRGQRRDKPLIRVNCASIPKDLYESEFFGHAKGAFTGAIKDRAGRFEMANGGTLFLDEIGEVPLDLQSKLLRVLQEKHYERVGEDRTRRADVRIVAATNRDLKKEVEAGRFREDLYYRLNVFPIQIAPLRQRRDDIPLLAQHFVQRSIQELRCPKPRLTRAGVVQLQGYDWPGNVRELQNVIERAVILACGGVLEFDLPVRDAPPATRPQGRPTNEHEPEFLTEIALRQRKRENLLTVLEKAHWKIKGPDGAAELLGVKPNTLLARIRAMKLKRPG